jgi:ssDNA-specific exonuclease RecJ
LLIFLLSSFIGIKITEEFHQLLGIIKKEVKKDQVILKNQIKGWGEWRRINYTYIIFLIILFIGLTFVKIKKFKI